jgi:formate hydrogenlyase subunit 3/multisubunit Na+/H+ antiporter MnhD subunit
MFYKHTEQRESQVFTSISNNPIGAITLLLAVVLILGLPPSAMFLTELMIFKALIDKNFFGSQFLLHCL